MDSSILLKLALLPIFIGLNAFFVAAEYAVVTIRGSRVEELENEGVEVARVLARLKEDINDALATMQILITATNLLIGAITEPALTHVILAVLKPLGIVIPERIFAPFALAIALGIVTFFTVVLSELLPKALSLQYTEKVALVVARPVQVLSAICRPVARLMNWTAHGISRLLGLGRVRIEEPVHTEAELEILVDRADEAGEFHEEHGELLRRAFDFADLNVSHVMIPMHQAGVMDSNVTVGELAKRLSERPYTRWPLRDPKTGRINGVVSIKMVLYAIAQAAGQELILHDLAVRPHALDPDLPLLDALTEMRKARQHLCVVRDTTGPELGIVTLEDILAAIAGELPKEVRPKGLPAMAGRPTTPAPPRPPAPSPPKRPS